MKRILVLIILCFFSGTANSQSREESLKKLGIRPERALTTIKQSFGPKDGDEYFQHLHVLPNLEEVVVEDCQHSGAGFVSLKNLPKLHTILMWDGAKCIDGLVRAIPPLRLRRLALFGSRATPEHLRIIADTGGLEEFSIDQVNGAHLAQIGRMTGLRKLSATKLNGSVSDFQALGNLKSLVELNVSESPNITDDHLLNIGTLSGLQKLSYQDTKATGEFLEHAPFPNLQSIIAGGTGMNDEAMKYIADLKHLSNFDPGMRVTDEGVCELKKSQSLKVLNLHGLKISNDGIECLRGHPSLENIDLGQTKVTDDVFEILLTMPKLRIVSMGGESKVTDKAYWEYHRQRKEKYGI